MDCNTHERTNDGIGFGTNWPWLGILYYGQWFAQILQRYPQNWRYFERLLLCIAIPCNVDLFNIERYRMWLHDQQQLYNSNECT